MSGAQLNERRLGLERWLQTVKRLFDYFSGCSLKKTYIFSLKFCELEIATNMASPTVNSLSKSYLKLLKASLAIYLILQVAQPGTPTATSLALQGFMLAAQQETWDPPLDGGTIGHDDEVDLKVFLMNDQQYNIRGRPTLQTEDILEVQASFLVFFNLFTTIGVSMSLSCFPGYVLFSLHFLSLDLQS